MNGKLNATIWIVLTAIVAFSWITACEDSVSVQDNALIEGQYLVIFHERWDGGRTSQTAEDVRAFTDRFLSDTNISADSVIARFEYALRGFTARMDETMAKSLMDDPRVDYVEQDRRFRVISFFAG